MSDLGIEGRSVVDQVGRSPHCEHEALYRLWISERICAELFANHRFGNLLLGAEWSEVNVSLVHI